MRPTGGLSFWFVQQNRTGGWRRKRLKNRTNDLQSGLGLKGDGNCAADLDVLKSCCEQPCTVVVYEDGSSMQPTYAAML